MFKRANDTDWMDDSYIKRKRFTERHSFASVLESCSHTDFDNIQHDIFSNLLFEIKSKDKPVPEQNPASAIIQGEDKFQQTQTKFITPAESEQQNHRVLQQLKVAKLSEKQIQEKVNGDTVLLSQLSSLFLLLLSLFLLLLLLLQVQLQIVVAHDGYAYVRYADWITAKIFSDSKNLTDTLNLILEKYKIKFVVPKVIELIKTAIKDEGGDADAEDIFYEQLTSTSIEK